MNTLRARLIATFLIVAVAAVGIVGLLSVTRARQAIIDTAWKEGTRWFPRSRWKVNIPEER